MQTSISSAPRRDSKEIDADGNDFAHEIGDEHLAPEGVARDTRRVVHGGAEEVVRLMQRVAGLKADPDADRR